MILVMTLRIFQLAYQLSMLKGYLFFCKFLILDSFHINSQKSEKEHDMHPKINSSNNASYVLNLFR